MVTTPIKSEKPCLWVADRDAVVFLASRFAVGDLLNPKNEEIAQGWHIILVDADTSEAVVRNAIYQIRAAGSDPGVYQSRLPIRDLVADQTLSPAELSGQFLEFSRSWDKWLESRVGQKLSIKEARDVAAVVLKYSSSPKLELEEIRQRCGVPSWDWKAIIKELSPSSVTGDSDNSGDSCNPVRMDITATVTTVTNTLQAGLTDYEECQRLEEIQANSVMGKTPFWQLVSALKTQLDEVQPEDEIRLENLINWHNAEIDFKKALPSMADDLIHDAAVLNIEPVALWQPLLAATTSLVGKRVKLDVESHTVPAITYTCTIAESGAGKTRAEKVVLTPLKKLQIEARNKFLADWELYQQQKDNDSDGKPQKPVERKYMFEVATIQAVIRRLAEQGENGSLWARDEIAGLFKSFGQFSKGDNEGLECLLKLWDGDAAQVDRVSQEDSFIIEETALSITGNIQPGAYRKAFKDPDDPQGLQARFLYALVKTKKLKRVKGYCLLSEKLPDLYEWLQNCPMGTIKLSKQADSYYDKLYEIIGEQAWATSMSAIKAWMFKLPTQLLRIALALHVLECYHDCTRNFWEIQIDTLERAVLFAQYYRSVFQVVQEKTADSDDITSILLKIWDAAITKHPDGISTRDAYRSIKAIQDRAKEARRDIAAYTADLFFKLQEMGKGQVVKHGRQIRFVAVTNPPPIHPIEVTKQKNHDISDTMTISENKSEQTIEVSPDSALSPVTDENNTDRKDTIAQTAADTTRPSDTSNDLTPSLKVGDPVTHSNIDHVRHGMEGIIEKASDLRKGAWVVRWLQDGESQTHEAHRTYSVEELKSTSD